MKDLSFLSLQVKQLEKIISKFEIMEKFMNVLQKTENVEIAKDEADIDEFIDEKPIFFRQKELTDELWWWFLTFPSQTSQK